MNSKFLALLLLLFVAVNGYISYQIDRTQKMILGMFVAMQAGIDFKAEIEKLRYARHKDEFTLSGLSRNNFVAATSGVGH